MMTINEISLQIGELITPFFIMMFGIVMVFWIKDWAGNIAHGLMFKFFGPFKEGDHVMLDDHNAVVVKIGLSTTVFGCNDDKRGYIWRYVPNDKIDNLKLGKVISKAKKL